jgi:hypothetical protein
VSVPKEIEEISMQAFHTLPLEVSRQDSAFIHADTFQSSTCNFCNMERNCVKCNCGLLACFKELTPGGCVDPYLLGLDIAENKCKGFKCTACALKDRTAIQVEANSCHRIHAHRTSGMA